jgi:hypothetical protein
MNRKEQIRLQLEQGLPSEWISDEVVEAVAYALGNQFMKAAPELAEDRHALALVKYARRIEEAK